MEPCVMCGKPTYTIVSGIGHLCKECREVEKQKRIIEKSKTLTTCSDFKTWDHGDMSELFWIHLGRYVKEPNPESLNYMDMAYRWACHDSHGLSNSFSHALKWAGIDLWAEDRKWAAKQKEQSE